MVGLGLFGESSAHAEAPDNHHLVDKAAEILSSKDACKALRRAKATWCNKPATLPLALPVPPLVVEPSLAQRRTPRAVGAVPRLPARVGPRRRLRQARVEAPYAAVPALAVADATRTRTFRFGPPAPPKAATRRQLSVGRLGAEPAPHVSEMEPRPRVPYQRFRAEHWGLPGTPLVRRQIGQQAQPAPAAACTCARQRP